MEKRIYDITLDTLKKSAPGLSDTTRQAIARNIGLKAEATPTQPAGAVPDNLRALKQALADLTDAFLSRHGCFPLDQTNEDQRHWRRAMTRAYELVGQPNTPQREALLSTHPAGQSILRTNAATDKIADISRKRLRNIRARWEADGDIDDGEVSFLLRLAEMVAGEPDEPRYQYREIGEGQDWTDCTRDQYERFGRDPHMNTREVSGHPAGQSAGSGAERDQVDAGLIQMLIADNARMRAAGTKLSEASLRVIREYDGTHRLSLAVAEWAEAIANEGGRADRFKPAPVSTRTGDEGTEEDGWRIVRSVMRRLAAAKNAGGIEDPETSAKVLGDAVDAGITMCREALAARPAAPEAQRARPEPGVAVEDSPLWTPEQRRLSLGNYMDYYGKPLGWKDD